MTAGRRAWLVTGLMLVALVARGCALRATEPPTAPPATLLPAHRASDAPQPTRTELSSTLCPESTPVPGPLPSPVEAATPTTHPGPPQWTPANEGIPGQIGVAAVAVAPLDSAVVYMAAYEPDGLYRSDNAGETWDLRGDGLGSLAPISLAVDPRDPNVVWVGTVAGAFRTTDGGQRWQRMGDLPRIPIYAFAMSPGGLLYAGGEGPGVWRSDDGGQGWSLGALGSIQGGILSLAIAGDGMVHGGTAGWGVWASRDGGETWKVAGEALSSTHVTVLQAVADDRLYALADGQILASRNGGGTWETCGPPALEALSFAAVPGQPDRLYLGSRGQGLAVSRDGGVSWILTGKSLRRAELTCLAGDTLTGRVYLGTRYNGLYRTTDGGVGWELISGAVGRPVVMALAQDPANPQILYAGTLDGVYRSADGGAQWRLASGTLGKLSVQALALGPLGDRVLAGTRAGVFVSEDGGQSWRWATEDLGEITVFAVTVDPHDGERIYAGTWGHNVLRSTDGGGHWAPIHHGLETLSAHAFAVDPADPQRLYAGTVEAVYVSTDGGEQWQASPLTERPLTSFALVVDAANAGVLFSGTTEGVYRSQDGGLTWQGAGQEHLGVTVTTLHQARTDPRQLYAGTEHHGLYCSCDEGRHWQPWGLDGVSVYTILEDTRGVVWLGTDEGIFKEPWPGGCCEAVDSQSGPDHPGRRAAGDWTRSRAY